MTIRVLLAAALLTAGSPKTAKRPAIAPVGEEQVSPKEQPIPEDLREKVKRSLDYGLELYLHDKVAAIGTDVVVENLHGQRLEDQGLAGYLTVRETNPGKAVPQIFGVVFYSSEQPPRTLFRVHVPIARDSKPTFERVNPPEPMDATGLALVKARAAAMKAAAPFQQSVNTVVLPAGPFGEREGDLMVELLAGTRKPNTIVLGKHYRVIVSADGVVRSTTPLSKQPIELDTRGPDGAEVVALSSTQLVEDYPLETHVFASRQAKLPLYLMNDRGFWRVDGEKLEIKFLGAPGK